MFAEELTSNASRKRAEEARNRRRQLIQKQQQQTKNTISGVQLPVTLGPPAADNDVVAETEIVAANGKKASESTISDSADTTNPPDFSSTMPPVSKPALQMIQNQTSAVALALEQRKIRSAHRQRQTSAVTIQSYSRSYLSNKSVLKKQYALFDKRMGDLMTLNTILKQAGSLNGCYVPPPATASMMVHQLLFLTHSTPRTQKVFPAQVNVAGDEVEVKISYFSTISIERGDVTRVCKLLHSVVLPGLLCKDEVLDPLLPWLGSIDGHARLKKLLRLCVSSLTANHSNVSAEADLFIVDRFLRVVLGVFENAAKTTGDGLTSVGEEKARDAIVKASRAILLAKDAQESSGIGSVPPSSLGVNIGNNPLEEDHIDLIKILRALLLYDTGGSKPIPPDAEKMRGGCIFQKDKERASRFFGLTFDAVLAVKGDTSLQSRFFADIMTVPLLTWKISSLQISKLISCKTPVSSPPLTDFLRTFIVKNADLLSAGNLGAILPLHDVPLAVCPAPSSLCLLANMVQLCVLCPALNGSDLPMLDFEAAATYFNMLATLVDSAPLGVFSSRRSAVEWVTDGAHLTPIVLSPVILDQCKTLLLDSFVRNCFKSAVDDDVLDTNNTISLKTEKDIQHQKDLAEIGASSAAKEAMVDRSKSFWQTSKWAKNLTKSMSTMFSADNKLSKTTGLDSPVLKGEGELVNTSSLSRQLAHGGGSNNRSTMNAVLSKQAEADEQKERATSSRAQPYTPVFFYALCRMYGAILSKWGGGGSEDIVKRAALAPSRNCESLGNADPCVLSLLNVLCFSTDIVKTSWGIVQSDMRVIADLYVLIDAGKGSPPIRSLNLRPVYNSTYSKPHNSRECLGSVVLFMFVSCLSHILIITDDIEIHEMDKPLPPHQIRRCILLLKQLLYRACCCDDVHASRDAPVAESNHFGLSLISAAAKTMKDLYDRSSRRPFCVPKLWLVEDLLEKDIKRCKTYDEFAALLNAPVLRVCPFLVSFKRRLRIFERIVTTNRIAIQGSNEQQNLRPGVVVRIMRGRVLEDGLIHLNKLGSNLRQRIVVQYVNEAGAKEVGVDVGGLFKEFWSDLSNLAFNENYALFRVTEGSGNCLYPNPSSRAAHGSDSIILFEFLGRILGKALFEGITIQPQFAHFFLSFLRGDYNFFHMLPDLSTMDPTLYNNLMFLKTYDGDAKDLCLTFTVANDDFGGNKEVALLPNGSEIEVSNSNKQRYIGLMAKHHVCDRVKEQSEAFTRGLWEVIDKSWLRLFNEPELQVLISGASDGKIDINDMKANVRYVGGYSGLDKNVYRFWNVVSSFNSKEQADLLRFVTSCERPPPLGFSSMNPPFTIQRVGIMRDGDKLPSASTCFNTLKLPTYSSEKVLRDRLLYAIQSGAGFELS